MILRIAIVDDELLYRRILDEKINIWAEKNNIADNMEVSVFEEPEGFFKAHLRNPFNIVLMDIYMNDMNGIDAALKLRNDENCKQTVRKLRKSLSKGRECGIIRI